MTFLTYNEYLFKFDSDGWYHKWEQGRWWPLYGFGDMINLGNKGEEISEEEAFLYMV